ncbi:gustatory and odorant receptor 24 isoform X2 [Anabrus simplex]|uniref:gustatory and odorant receptor 24 isoform X2 n=1 Tax=Anabrus simplex TaxID=316456 RepID=UPI0035A2EAE3
MVLHPLIRYKKIPITCLIISGVILGTYMSRTMELVASIDRTLLDLEVQLELDMFQRQLIANTFVFSAGGFFDINMAQITNIVSSTATYIIILMQFQET